MLPSSTTRITAINSPRIYPGTEIIRAGPAGLTNRPYSRCRSGLFVKATACRSFGPSAHCRLRLILKTGKQGHAETRCRQRRPWSCRSTINCTEGNFPGSERFFGCRILVTLTSPNICFPDMQPGVSLPSAIQIPELGRSRLGSFGRQPTHPANCPLLP